MTRTACWCRTATPTRWPGRSSTWRATRTVPPDWARPAGTVPCRGTTGRRSPSGRSRSTASSSAPDDVLVDRQQRLQPPGRCVVALEAGTGELRLTAYVVVGDRGEGCRDRLGLG